MHSGSCIASDRIKEVLKAAADSGAPTVADSESTEMDTRASGYRCRKLTACQSCPDEITPVAGIDFLQSHEPDAKL